MLGNDSLYVFTITSRNESDFLFNIKITMLGLWETKRFLLV